MTLSFNEKKLLAALKSGKHFKANPGAPNILLSMSSDEANPVGRRLVALGLAALVRDSERPAALLLRITDAGISEADKLGDAARKATWKEQFKALPVGKGTWEVVKLALAALFGAAVKTYIG